MFPFEDRHLWNYVETWREDVEVTHFAVVLERQRGASQGAITACGMDFRSSDQWVRGFSLGEKPSMERVTCPKCLERMREEYA